jgi:hypothetical protein
MLTARKHSPGAINAWMHHFGYFVGVIVEWLNKYQQSHTPVGTQKDAKLQTQVIGSMVRDLKAKLFVEGLAGADKGEDRWTIADEKFAGIETRYDDKVGLCETALLEMLAKAAANKSSNMTKTGVLTLSVSVCFFYWSKTYFIFHRP